MSDEDDDDSMRAEEDIGPDESDEIGEKDDDTLRIMVCTDNHLGYCESDPIRGLDSFAAFEEILFLAKHFKCDMVLIAGDLFHDNKPSRRTLHKTMDIIRRYCMGPDPVNIQILSNQEKNFRSNGKVNYEDEFYSVDLPIFSIHGNHDDPTRVDGGTEMLAALDLLAVSNLVNYFGRQDEVDKVEVSPILLQKGSTRVAIYGMGSMRDERLHRMWVGKKVRFSRPAEEDDDDEENKWFNVFALHQNRDLGRGSKNCVHESMIPEWMDLVVWGHEHECRIEPGESVIGTFRISQPGSSVATSLISGEAVRKHVGVLDIRNNQFRLKPIPLTQVRSFAMSDVSLRELKDRLDPEDPKIDDKVTKVLEDEVKMVIREARQKTKELLADAMTVGNIANKSRLKYKLEQKDAVLVRVKVEHSGFTTINSQRFGAKFVGHVANASDILLFHRRKQEASADDSKAGAKKRGATALGRPIAPAELETEIKVEDLVRENLEMADKKLEILSEHRLTIALDEFVSKEQSKSIEDAMEVMLGSQQKKLVSGGASVGEKAPNAVVSASKDACERTLSDRHDDDNDDISETSEKEVKKVGSKRKNTTATKSSSVAAKRVASSRKKIAKVPDWDENDDDIELVVDKQPKRSTARAATRPQRVTTVARKKYNSESEEEQEESLHDDSIDDNSDFSDTNVRSNKATRNVSSLRKAKPTQLSFQTTRRSNANSTRQKQATKRRAKDERVDDDSEDDRFVGKSYDVDEDWEVANTETQS